MVKLNQKAPEFNVQAFHENDIKKINLNGYRGKWVILVFYPADFTFVCPTELGDFADRYEGKIQIDYIYLGDIPVRALLFFDHNKKFFC